MKSPRNIGCMNELGHGIMIRDHRKLLMLACRAPRPAGRPAAELGRSAREVEGGHRRSTAKALRSVDLRKGSRETMDLTRNQRKRLRWVITVEVVCSGLDPEVLLAGGQRGCDPGGGAARRKDLREDLAKPVILRQGSGGVSLEHVDPISCIQEACVAAGSEKPCWKS